MTKMFLGVSVATVAIVFADDHASKPAPAVAPASADARVASTNEVTVQKTSSFLGMPVHNDQGSPIGKVSDLVFDFSTGKIGYAVVSFSESQQKDRRIAVPLSALKSGGVSHLVLNISQPVVAASESLVEGYWPPVDAFSITSVGRPAQGEAGKGSSVEPK